MLMPLTGKITRSLVLILLFGVYNDVILWANVLHEAGQREDA